MNIRLRSLAVWSCAVMLWLSVLGSVSAQTVTFDLKGVPIELQEVTADAPVFFRSLRLNRALNQWNVEVTVSNRADRALSGPLVLLVESFRGTTGPLSTDGTLSGASPRAFYDLSSLTPGGELGAHQSTASRTLSLGFSTGSPVLVTRVFAGSLPPPVPIGVTRSLNDVGQPLPGATLTVTGPGDGSSSNQTTDRPTGVASFGETAGSHRLKFSQEGSLSVWRQQTLSTGSVAVVPNPRLTTRSSRVVEVTPLGGSVVTNDTGTVRISVNAGAFGGSASLRLTGLTGQTLPAFLPQGWSPLQSFHLETSSAPTQPLPATLKPSGSVGAAEVAALVRWNEGTLAWDVVQVLGGRGTEPLDVLLPTSGSFAMVVGDSGELAPPVPIVGQHLAASQAAAAPIEGLTATGVVDPSSSPASQVPVRVTGQATVTLRHPSSKLPSGTLLRGEVTETYLLKDGSSRITPPYEQFLVAYQRPGDDDLTTLQAAFPMRPLLLFGVEELSSATVRIDVLPNSRFVGSVLHEKGGSVGAGNVRVIAGIGYLSRPTPAQVRSLSLAPFLPLLPLSHSAIAAFDLTLDGTAVSQRLQLQVSGIASNQWFVLSRVISDTEVFGLEPVERLLSDSRGVLSSSEPTSGLSLPGIQGSGLFVLLQVGQPQGLITGVVKDGSGQPSVNMPVRVEGTPWLTRSRSDGSYTLLAPAGNATVVATDLTTGDSGQQSIVLPPTLVTVSASPTIAPVGPRVVSISPATGATKVALITSVAITFSEAVNPATVVGDAVQLLGLSNAPVAASLSLDARRTRLTLTPATSLDADTLYRVVLAKTVADVSGLTLVGTNEFRFTTLSASRVGESLAEMVIYQPGATNVPAAILAQIPGYKPGSIHDAIVVHGTQGTADPEVPVILLNEGTGETSTVLSKIDGSFSSVIAGTDEDLISATFVNANGTRNVVKTFRQQFDDGFVGLYSRGGSIEVESVVGPMRITVPPGAVATRTKFKPEPLTVPALKALLGDVMPADGVVAGAAINLRIEGQVPTLPLKIRIPVDLAALNYPTNEDPTNAAVILVVARDAQDVTSFQVVDQMVFTPQSSQPPPKIQLSGNGEQLASGFLDTSVGFAVGMLGGPGLAAQFAINQVLIPLMIGARPIAVKGKVAALPIELSIALEQAGLLSQVLNFQTGEEKIDVPVQILQMLGAQNPLLKYVPGLSQAGQLASTSVTLLQQQTIIVSKPLGGAFVNLTLQGGGLAQRPGRIYPGMVYSTSDPNGYFLLMAPAGSGIYKLRATHPLYDEIREELVRPLSPVPGSAGDFGLSASVWKNFFFAVPKLNETPPNVSVGNVPVLPGPGQACQVVINASLLSVAPRVGVVVESLSQTNLLTGRRETNVTSILTNVVKASVGTSTKYTADLIVNKPVTATLKITIAGETGDQGSTFRYPIQFAGPIPGPANGDLPKPDTNDVHGPLVIQTEPLDNGYINDRREIKLIFNKPIDAYVKEHAEGISLSGIGAVGVKPAVILSPGQQSLTLRYPSLPPDNNYQLTLTSQSIRDLSEQPLDQVPSTTEPDSFTLTFRTPPAATATLPGIVNGKGSAISGRYAYVLDQGDQASYLKVFDLESPLRPSLAGQLPLIGAPRDLAVIPKFGFKRNAESPVETADLVAVVGGNLDAMFNNVLGAVTQVKGQYLWIVSMKDPTKPEVIASTLLTLRVGSAVTKIRWSPPVLAYEEFGADIQLVGLVNLQEMIFGLNTPRGRALSFPPNGRPGVDLNGDGDYVDQGETLPLPQAQPSEFYGKQQSYVLENTTQKILDFAVSGGGSTIGVTLKAGRELNTNGQPVGATLPPMYRTLVSSGIRQDIPNPIAGMVRFGDTAYPRWVSIFEGLPVLINDVATTRNIAFVSLAPDTNGVDTLLVIDISVPLSPKELNRIAIPTDLLGGNIGPVTRRSDGVYEIAGGQHTLRLDMRYLTVTNFPPAQLSPAIAGSSRGGSGLTRTVGSTEYGLQVVADGGRAQVAVAAPELRFVSFPNRTGLIATDLLANQTEDDLSKLFEEITPLTGLAPATITNALTGGSDLQPPNPALHYYVLMIAPGVSGSKVNLGLESLNTAGRPYANFGVDFAPVRAIADMTQLSIQQTPKTSCGAPIRALPSYRVSNDPTSKFYNYYLSRPFALVASAMSSSDLTHFQASGGAEREILFSGASLRAFIEPQESVNFLLGAFAGRIDFERKVIDPISRAQAIAINRSYLVGDNPPPPGEPTPLEDTYGTILAHSGEIRTSDVDMSLPSARMPINIIRSIGTQDSYEGPFGVGWDFNYNQNLTVMDPASFPPGLQLPLVVRDNPAHSDIAGSQDVLFANGGGRVYQFIWKGTNLPPEYAEDPLVRDFNYAKTVADYYLPNRGLFDLLVRFKDGRFERLSPEGVRYRYTPMGRLETIIDTFPNNRHELQYDANGWLVRIDDRSVTSPRYVEFGYYKHRGSDSQFRSGLDERTTNPFLDGKVCRLRDYTDRDVLFEYDEEGFLITTLGIQVDGQNGGYAGRSHTFYTYKDCKLVGFKAKANGTPVVAVVNQPGASGKPVARATSSSMGNTEAEIPADNSATKVASQQSGVKLADGASVQRRFDELGHTASQTMTGNSGKVATQVISNTVDGLIYYLKNPEGDFENRTYDSANSVFRSRGNLIKRTVSPGPRGGEGYTEHFQYDTRYNLQSGDQTDANGFVTAYALTSDGRSVGTVSYPGVGSKVMTYNSRGQLTSVADQDGVEASYEYNAATGFLGVEHKGDIVTTYGFDGSLASRLGKPSSIKSASSAATKFSYDQNLLPTRVERGGLVTRTAYDELGRDIFMETQVGDGRAKSITKEYDDSGFITKITTAGLEVDGTVATFEENFKPDNRSRVREASQPNGTTTVYKYDDRGNVTELKVGTYTETYEYDLNNNLVKVIQGGEELRSTVYDGLNRAKTVLTRTGTATYTESSSFYPGGQLRSRSLVDPKFGTLQETTYPELDSIGRHKKVAVLGGVISPTYTYTYGPLQNTVAGPRLTAITKWNKAGQQVEYTDPIHTLRLERDENGRVRKSHHDEEGAFFEQTFGYDDLDHQISIEDFLGKTFDYVPRADGVYTKVINARNHASTFDYTALGEPIRRARADGMETKLRYNTQRQNTFTGESTEGFAYSYDTDMRMTRSTMRDGGETIYSEFDPRKMPRKITFPGGSSTLSYDLQRRLIGRTMTYQGWTWEESTTYDALSRIRSQSYKQNGGVENAATFKYDPAGPLLESVYREDNAEFKISYGYYEDGTRKTVTYPSGLVITEVRDSTGRLTALGDIQNGVVATALSWQGNNQPKVVELSTTMRVVNEYDARGRLTGSRAIRRANGAILAHMRYQYDGANNVEARQYLHRNGRMDRFEFDLAERLSAASVGGIPLLPSGSTPTLYDRDYTYDSTHKDFLASSHITTLIPDVPAFAQSWAGHDAFLSPTVVDGFVRGASDPKGNVVRANLWTRREGDSAPQAVPGSLKHDGFGRLLSITLTDGTVIENQFRAGGLRFSRKITRSGALVSSIHFVYDLQGRLLEEYDRTGAQPVLVARYIYGSSDAPTAADLIDPDTGKLARYFYLRDVAQSVVAIADKGGNVVERVWYDPHGQPVIEARDEKPPVVREVLAGDAGSLLVVMSEAIVPVFPDPGPGGGIHRFRPLNLATNTLSVTVSNTVVPGSAELVPALPGYAPYTVVRFTPEGGNPLIASNATLTVSAGQFQDEWANANATATVSLASNTAPGALYYRAQPVANTAAAPRAQSTLRSPFLFQGQYFDYELGLVYMRARYYDPYSGMFLEPDPLGYDSSVNLYAGLGNNPVSTRDPLGLAGRPVSQTARNTYLRSQGYKPHEIHLINQGYHALSKLGMGDIEIAAHIRVMSKSLRDNNVNWEISIRSFSNPEARKLMLNSGFQTKEEKVSNKTQADGLAVHENADGSHQLFTGDLDGLYLMRNGQVASLNETKRFQNAVNDEVARLHSGWQGVLGEHGHELYDTEVQKAYQHGMSLNIPQEYGGRNEAMKKNGRVGIAVFDWIESKMKKGTGTAFAFSLDGEGKGLNINESVNVNKMLDLYENHYNNILLNPKASGFDRSLFNRRFKQSQIDGRAPMTLFPNTFRGHKYGEPGLN